jgi:colanic acid biosynthesis glycosyl transferase WcaI
MKAVILSQWYPPEQAPIGYMVRELAQAMIARGHKVTVITGFPNHPSGKVFGGYRKQWCLKEEVDGIDIWRMYLYTAPNSGKLSRILTFVSFTLTSAWALLAHPRFDLLFAVFQPLSVGFTLPLVAKVKRARLVLNVQDLHPDVPIELGLIRNQLLITILRWVERFGYRSANGLAVICDQFRRHCVAKGANASNVEVIPNWIDLDEIVPGSRENGFRAALGLSPGHIIVMFAGTIGFVAGAEVILQAAGLLRDVSPDVRFVFVGEGPVVRDLKDISRTNGLTNVAFVPFQPRAMLAEVQAASDISLVTMRHGKGRASVPSKVLGYMAAARPVIAAVDADSETASLVNQAGCGQVVQPEDGVALAGAIAALAAASDRRCELGASGRRYLETNYQKEAITGQYVQFFEDIVGRA